MTKKIKQITFECRECESKYPCIFTVQSYSYEQIKGIQPENFVCPLDGSDCNFILQKKEETK